MDDSLGIKTDPAYGPLECPALGMSMLRGTKVYVASVTRGTWKVLCLVNNQWHPAPGMGDQHIAKGGTATHSPHILSWLQPLRSGNIVTSPGTSQISYLRMGTQAS